MTLDEIAEKLAEEANMCCGRSDGYEENLRANIRAALHDAEERGRREERERCAKVAEAHPHLAATCIDHRCGDVIAAKIREGA